MEEKTMKRKGDNPYVIRSYSVKTLTKCIEPANNVERVNEITGEVISATELVTVKRDIDTQRFVKLYNLKILENLTSVGLRMMMMCLRYLEYDGSVYISKDYFLKKYKYKNRRSYYDGIEELQNLDVIRKTECKNIWWFNPNIACVGDRNRITKVERAEKPWENSEIMTTEE